VYLLCRSEAGSFSGGGGCVVIVAFGCRIHLQKEVENFKAGKICYCECHYGDFIVIWIRGFVICDVFR
jgi:hypothetical protein